MKSSKNDITKRVFQIILSILLSTAFSFILFFYREMKLNVFTVLGLSFITLGLTWLILFLFSYFLDNKAIVPFLFPGFIFTSIGIPFSLQEINFLDFVFYIGLSMGICLLIAGIYWRLLGLIIPGALLIGVPPGLYFAWESTQAANALEQTGIMLVTFAFGWGLITIASRALTKSFVWWPLIPGGILAVVGWALFIAGNPGSAIGFIGNTGSVGLIIFGIYILLMRRSFHQ